MTIYPHYDYSEVFTSSFPDEAHNIAPFSHLMNTVSTCWRMDYMNRTALCAFMCALMNELPQLLQFQKH